jgi:hypothetical protein
MGEPWNKGLTKATHLSLQKTSETMRRRKLDNFARWRNEAKETGLIRRNFPAFRKNGDLAELLGVMLGDGHIQKFPRTERLLIFSNSNNHGFIKRYTTLVEKLFEKKPYVYQQTGTNCTRISLYEKHISKRAGMPTGPRKSLIIKIPDWILQNRTYSRRYLRGLYEAEGSYSVHLPTSTHKLNFSNTNQSMLKNVVKLLTVLGFSPHFDLKRVQLSKREEVERAIKELEFRKY